jgi:hypothetical protein
MLLRLGSVAPLAVVAGVALAVGYVLPRSRSEGDLMDAVAAVQRRSPWFVVSQPHPPADWVRTGALYLCRTPRSAAEVDGLSKHPSGAPAWDGVVCFKGTLDPRREYHPWLADGGARCITYQNFAVFGDPRGLEEICGILAAAGFEPLR